MRITITMKTGIWVFCCGSFIGGCQGNIHRSDTEHVITECCIKHTVSCAGMKRATLDVTGTDCIGRCKSKLGTVQQY